MSARLSPLCRRRYGVSYGLLVLAIGLLVLLPATASARDFSFDAAFSANTHLGEGGSLSADLFFSGTEYHGQVAPLTGLTLRLPEGIGLDSTGFPTCSKETLEQFGPIKCPPGSYAGERGSMRAIVYFPEAKEEEAEVRTYFGPGGVLLFYVDGHSPVSLENVFEGHFVSDSADPPYGQDLVIEEIPTMQQSPSSPDVSITDLTLNIGTTEEIGGSEVSSLTLPSTCPGSFTWDAELTFLGEPSEAIPAFSTGCPSAGAREATATTLTVSNPTPYENEPVTYTATVTPSDGGPLPTGTVTFYGTDCGARPLVEGVGSATATCQESYPNPEEYDEDYDIAATYNGSEADRGSSSPSVTIHVQSGEAPPKHEEEPAPKHEEPLSTSSSGSTGGSGGSSSDGSSTGSNTTTPVATISSAQLVASLSRQLIPTGKAATIGALLKHGGLSVPFTALEAGTLSVQWYYAPKGARVAKVKPVVVVAGRLTFAGAMTGRLTLRLTATGERVLRYAKRLSLTARGTFVSRSATPVISTTRLVIER
jgi:hypothetical protein